MMSFTVDEMEHGIGVSLRMALKNHGALTPIKNIHDPRYSVLGQKLLPVIDLCGSSTAQSSPGLSTSGG